MHGAGIRRFGPQETQEFSRAKRNVTVAFSPTPVDYNRRNNDAINCRACVPRDV